MLAIRYQDSLIPPLALAEVWPGVAEAEAVAGWPGAEAEVAGSALSRYLALWPGPRSLVKKYRLLKPMRSGLSSQGCKRLLSSSQAGWSNSPANLKLTNQKKAS